MSSRKRNLLAGGPKTNRARASATDSTTSSASANSSQSSILSFTRQQRSSSRTQGFAFEPELNPVDPEIEILSVQPVSKRIRRSSHSSTTPSSSSSPSKAAASSNSPLALKKVVEVIDSSHQRQPTPVSDHNGLKPGSSLHGACGLPTVPEEPRNQARRTTRRNVRDRNSIDVDMTDDDVKPSIRAPEPVTKRKGSNSMDETTRTLKKIKLDPGAGQQPSFDVSVGSASTSTVRDGTGKRFRKAKQGSFFFDHPTQRISATEMSIWTG